MKRFTFHSAAILILFAAGPALAAPISFSGGGGMGGGHRHGGRGHGGLDVDVIQNRFEDQLADVMSAYDDGVADSEDYYSSDDYTDLVGETEWLVDSYDWFLTSVERTIGHIDDYIASANDELTFYDDLLAKYEARDDLSETRLERIVDWITSAQDMLTLRIETLTYKQTTLEDNLATYTTFQTDLTSYLDEIVAAGGGTVTTGDETEDAAAALQALALTGMGDCSAISDGSATAVTPVPEPSAAAGFLAIAGAAGWRAIADALSEFERRSELTPSDAGGGPFPAGATWTRRNPSKRGPPSRLSLNRSHRLRRWTNAASADAYEPRPPAEPMAFIMTMLRSANRIMPHLQTTRTPQLLSALAAIIATFAFAGGASAYVPDDRWSTTASGSTGSQGDVATITWSLVADGTSIVSEGSSNLISYMDGLFGSSGGGNLTTRPWFSLFQESFDRWTELGGIKFVYEPNDNSIQMGGNTAGSLGVRGDIRIGGATIDGASGTLAYTYLPNNGDMVIDTGETTFYSNSTNNYRQLRNTVMHELGHAFGLLHIESSSDHLLLEPYIDATFDGPQLDDIRGLHGLYGDVFEKTNNGGGNDSSSLAASLGAIAAGGSKSIGTAAASGQAVGADEIDFVSIANSSDYDFFSFTVNSASLLDVTLTPLGGVFMQGVEGGVQSTFDANARNDLTVSIYGTNGTTLLGTANNTAAGFAESLADVSLPAAGQYYVRISGSTANVQLYQLQLSVASAVVTQPGDFDGDGDADGNDLLVWQRSFGSSGTGLAADGNADGVVNGLDLAIWKNNFGESLGSVTTAVAAVPEPAAATLFLLSAAMLFRRKKAYKTQRD